MWSLSEGSFARSLPRSLSFFREALVADPDAADEFLVSIPCTSVFVVVVVVFVFFFLLMHLELKELKRIW
jgi:hypothetical protein